MRRRLSKTLSACQQLLAVSVLLVISIPALAGPSKRAQAKKLYDQVAAGVAKGGDVYNQPALYQLLALTPKKMVGKLVDLYGQEGAQRLANKMVSGLGNKYLPLLFDPGIADRLDEFISFSREKLPNYSRLKLETMRRRFADSLGDEVIYRGIGATTADIKGIRENGVSPRSFRNMGISGPSLGYYFWQGLLLDQSSKSFSQVIQETRGVEQSGLLNPATSYPIVAEGVAAFFGKRAQEADIQVLVLKVPKINILHTGGVISHRWDGAMDAFMRFWDPQTGQDLADIPMGDPGLELYLQGQILPQWIVGLKTIKYADSRIAWDQQGEYAAFNYSRVNLDTKGRLTVAESGIPYSTNDFFSILRNEPEAILAQDRLQNFLQTEAGPQFKLEFIRAMADNPFSDGETGNKAIILEGVSRLQKRVKDAPGFAGTVFQLLTDPDSMVRLHAIKSRQNMFFLHDSPQEEARFRSLLLSYAADPNQEASVRIESARLLLMNQTGSIRTLLGVSTESFLGFLETSCPRLGLEGSCYVLMDAMVNADPELRSSPQIAQFHQALGEALDQNRRLNSRLFSEHYSCDQMLLQGP